MAHSMAHAFGPKPAPSGQRIGSTGYAPDRRGSRSLPRRLTQLWHVWHDETDRFSESTSAAFVSRFVVLQIIGAAGLVSLWIAGLISKPFQGHAAPVCWIILAVGAIGLACVLLQRWRDVQWIATHVVRIGLLGTVIGLIIAFSAAANGDSSNPEDIKPMIAAVVSGMYVSLYATLLGVGTNLWLKINMRLLGDEHG